MSATQLTVPRIKEPNGPADTQAAFDSAVAALDWVRVHANAGNRENTIRELEAARDYCQVLIDEL